MFECVEKPCQKTRSGKEHRCLSHCINCEDVLISLYLFLPDVLVFPPFFSLLSLICYLLLPPVTFQKKRNRLGWADPRLKPLWYPSTPTFISIFLCTQGFFVYS